MIPDTGCGAQGWGETRTNREREEGERAEEEGSQTKCRELHTTGKWTVFIEHASSSAVPSVESCRDDYRGSGQGRGDPALTRQNQTP